MTRKTALFTDELTFWHHSGPHALILPAGGWVQVPNGSSLAESPESKRRLRNLIAVSGLERHLDIRTAPALTHEELRLVHPAAYLEKLKALSDAGQGSMGAGAPVGPGTYEIASLSAGLATAALEAVVLGQVDNAYALSRPPGHHCLPDQAMGFCFMANIPLAIETVKRRHKLGRVAVIDWDVHHGNGTQAVYEDRPDVLTISLHQEGCYPPGYSGEHDRGIGMGTGRNINIPLPAGSGHATYMRAMSQIVLRALDAFHPEVIIVACGFDANALDPLARMQLHSDSFREMTRMMIEAADRLCGGKLLLVHEGGYSEAYVPFCGLAVIEELTGHRTAVDDPLLPFITLQQPRSGTQKCHDARVNELTALFA
ncbi:class II histone deacetylase [Paracoccus litorisediminis]|uniref:Class II histone deacetylase n=1 Tax=Paracoccus litorisediminis TaxID=2006130 RepID=A0A844HM09_9RHOB|nr:class II histone deacetylase [Paracoccus litorisediminis]MTH61323.1 class II histone deacetylase [Paracoccus litorisediminis]